MNPKIRLSPFTQVFPASHLSLALRVADELNPQPLPPGPPDPEILFQLFR